MMRAAKNNSAGNAFFIVLLGVVLFAALMYTFARSARDGGSGMSEKQMELAVSDLLAYSQKLEGGVNRVLVRGLSENQLSFENGVVVGYANAGCALGACKVFDQSGGSLEWESPPPGINDGSAWEISGKNEVPDVGDDTTADLTIMLPNVKRDICLKINETLGVANPGGNPPQDSDDIDMTKFTGAFSNSERIGAAADLSGKRTACVMHTQPNPDTYVFYRVLVER